MLNNLFKTLFKFSVRILGLITRRGVLHQSQMRIGSLIRPFQAIGFFENASSRRIRRMNFWMNLSSNSVSYWSPIDVDPDSIGSR